MVKNQAGEDFETFYVRDINVGELGSGLGVGLSVNDYIGATQ